MWKMWKRKGLWRVIFCLAVLGLIFCGAETVKYQARRDRENDRYERIRGLAKESSLWSWLKPLTVRAEEEDLDSYAKKEIDFDALWGINEDVCAWITLPNTKVDYPVMWNSNEEDFYLDHDIDKNESYAGSIFLQKINQKDFSDFHTVLYGHDMEDGTMFGDLLLFQEKSVFERNDKIYVYLPERTLIYSIFGAYVWDSGHMLEEFDQEDWLQRRAYLAEIGYKCQEEECFDRELFETVTTEDRILTLSTCYHGDSESRFLVQAVLAAEVEKSNSADIPE